MKADRQRGGGDGRWVLALGAALVAALVTALVTATVAAEEEGDGESALSECRRFHATAPRPQDNLDFFTGNNGEDFGRFQARSPGGWNLVNAVRFHALDPVQEEGEWTVLCVGLVDTTSYSYADGHEYPEAWATLHTKRQVAAGLVRLSSSCWLHTKNFATCSPTFMSLPYLLKLPLYHVSPLEKWFWSNLTINATGVKPFWIWKINTQTNKGTIDPGWIYGMNISSLEEVVILGNDWRKPEKLLGHLPKVKRLDLSYNNLEIVPEEMFVHMPVLSTIILGHNNIAKYPSTVRHLTKLRTLDLTNPIGNATLRISDEDVRHFPKSLRILGLENTKLEANVTNMFFSELHFLNLSGCALKFINDYDEMNVISKLEDIDLSHNELEKLPAKIFLKMPDLRRLFLAHNNFKAWAQDLLANNSLIYFDFSHNKISNLTSNIFGNLKKLEHLDLSWNEVENISSTVFWHMQNLKYIDLSHNKLTFVPDMIFNYTLHISEINLSNNVLKEVPHIYELKLKILDLSHNELTVFKNNETFIEKVDLSYNKILNLSVSSSIQKINISYNSISFISPNMWSYLKQVKEVDVGGNNFECCLFENRTFLTEEHQTLVQNLGTVEPLTCSVNQTSPRILLQTFVYNETECIPPEAREISPIGIAVVLPLTVLIVTIGLIAVMMYVYRFELTYVRHLFRMKKVGAETDEQRYKTCVYDAFVCYSARNFEWVTGTLLPGLEGGPEGYRLCLHDRDFALGAGINRNIVASLEKSRKVIFVLSNDFIASKWCQWELEMANHKMFEEKRNYIILVELERLSRSSLPRHLRYLMDRTTYLEWPEEEAGTGAADGRRRAACFRRLREALGDSLHQRTGRDNLGFFTVLDAP